MYSAWCYVWFQKTSKPVPTPGKVINYYKLFKGKWEAKLISRGVGGFKPNTFCGKGMEIFWNNTTNEEKQKNEGKVTIYRACFQGYASAYSGPIKHSRPLLFSGKSFLRCKDLYNRCCHFVL